MENEKNEALAGKKTQETVQRLNDTVTKVIYTICKFVHTVCEILIPAFQNKKVVHLAKHSKKARVRKKNFNRMKKTMLRELKRSKMI